MKVLVVGNGGREHAVVWKVLQSPRISQVYCTRPNAGIANIAKAVDIAPEDIEALADFVRDEGIDFTVVGPEKMLSLGITDLFRERGLRIFGPEKKGARLEASKIYSKELMQRCGIPTAKAEIFTNIEDAISYIRSNDKPCVIKADGLAAGKGVVVAESRKEAEDAVKSMMQDKEFGEAGSRILIEERLIGKEATFLAFTDGETVSVMPSSQDHKRIYDGDKGGNTGGMGAFSPSSYIDGKMEKKVLDTVIYPVLKGLKQDGVVYKGVLYAGLMINPEDMSFSVLEFNCRFGDPEAQAVIPRLKSDIMDIFEAVSEGRLSTVNVEWRSEAALCVVLASSGYPNRPRTGEIVVGLEGEGRDDTDIIVFHAGTVKKGDDVITSGGRVLTVTALDKNLLSARAKCYDKIKKIHFDGMHYRKDIALM